MRNKVMDFMKQNNMLVKGDGILVAISGGPDSVCLLHILKSLQEEYQLKLRAVHINHLLRAQQSDQDERYVLDLCNEMDIPCTVNRMNIKKISEDKGISIEEAGRISRYELFFHLKDKYDLQKIALGQHKDDNAETILMRIIRGTGLQGLGGILPHREDGVIRPLLNTSRKEIEDYCKEHDLFPRMDESNFQPIYFRNKLRLEVIPSLEKLNPNVKENLNRLGQIIREEQDYMEGKVQHLWAENVRMNQGKAVLSVDWLLGLHPFLQKQMLRKGIKGVKNNLKEIEFTHIQLIIEMLANEDNTTWTLHFPHNIRIKRQYQELLIMEEEEAKKDVSFEYPLPLGKKVWIHEIQKGFYAHLVKRGEIDIIKDTMNKKHFDFQKVGTSLVIRNRRQGDRFRPMGIHGTKKLKDYFIDLKIPREQRGEVPIIAVPEGIVWVAGYKVDERYTVDKKTEDVLIIEYLQKEEENEQ